MSLSTQISGRSLRSSKKDECPHCGPGLVELRATETKETQQNDENTEAHVLVLNKLMPREMRKKNVSSRELASRENQDQQGVALDFLGEPQRLRVRNKSGRLASELRGPRSKMAFQWQGAPTFQTVEICSENSHCFTLGVGGIYVADRTFNASSVSRNFRTLWTRTQNVSLKFISELQISWINCSLRTEDCTSRLIRFSARRGSACANQTSGRATGANTALLPEPMRDKFSKLFDDAPQIPYSTVLSVFKFEFGRPPTGPDGVFEIFEEEAVASASIAQVHKAKGGGWVAVKVQKPDVGKQVEWDLGQDLHPVYFVVDFVSDHLRTELDFVQEAGNAAKMTELVATEPRPAGRVHIPLVYPELSTKKVMTAEWIEGVRLSDRPAIRRLMGEATKEGKIQASIDPERKVEGVKLKGGVKAVMQHHHPPEPGAPDAASTRPPRPWLYVYLTPTFKRQYAELWKGLISTNFGTVECVMREWDIGTPDLFAMTDTDKMPKEFIFLGRIMSRIKRCPYRFQNTVVTNLQQKVTPPPTVLAVLYTTATRTASWPTQLELCHRSAWPPPTGH
ncbi:hypothetical protein FIBSPDRAFT_892939 [Athelia psychrophila]|uniref:ABC1 atypical kinase-like domain-containing protein n=1 Tax=Athelia psychrophila TaxID=1759441 RepID=A0A166HR31_9AGAM|nr:hypothetical protein FIBSPDRAFT_892939 [Fibularhizoctonia sp. CBS 109695]